MQQSAVFGEDLHLIRRIEADVGGNEIRLRDRVVNHGFYRTPHMFFYHVNVGHPVLDEGSRYLAPIRDVVWAGHAGDATASRASATARCRRPQHGFASRSGSTRWRRTPAARCRWRSSTTASASASRSTTRKDQFPCLYEWQNLQAGQLRAGHRALDAPCARRPCGAGARRDDLARARRGARLRGRLRTCWTAPARIEAAAGADQQRSPDSLPNDFPVPSGQLPPAVAR